MTTLPIRIYEAQHAQLADYLRRNKFEVLDSSGSRLKLERVFKGEEDKAVAATLDIIERIQSFGYEKARRLDSSRGTYVHPAFAGQKLSSITVRRDGRTVFVELKAVQPEPQVLHRTATSKGLF